MCKNTLCYYNDKQINDNDDVNTLINRHGVLKLQK